MSDMIAPLLVFFIAQSKGGQLLVKNLLHGPGTLILNLFLMKGERKNLFLIGYLIVY
jgi:hypothetical protein